MVQPASLQTPRLRQVAAALPGRNLLSGLCRAPLCLRHLQVPEQAGAGLLLAHAAQRVQQARARLAPLLAAARIRAACCSTACFPLSRLGRSIAISLLGAGPLRSVTSRRLFKFKPAGPGRAYFAPLVPLAEWLQREQEVEEEGVWVDPATIELEDPPELLEV
jgi:hypothetical protein